MAFFSLFVPPPEEIREIRDWLALLQEAHAYEEPAPPPAAVEILEAVVRCCPSGDHGQEES